MKVLCNNKVIFNNITKADGFISRLVGLMNKKYLSDEEGLLLINCSSIHCFFMKITIDAVYLSKDMEVLYKETIKPWRIGKIVKKTKHILEIPENASQKIRIGDIIKFI
jgi:hypothetical protein